MAEHRHLVDQGAELVEIRLDYIRRDVNLKRLLRERPSPVVATCRRESELGRWSGTEEARRILLRSAIAEGVEYVDLEEDIAGGIPRYGRTKRIISLHNFRETPENLDEICARLGQMDADVVKLATMANDPYDNVRMLRAIRDSRIPTVGICMGEIGIPSRILAGKYGAPFTYATFHHERALAPGQLSYVEMQHVYHYDAVNADTEVYGVVADPVGHSLGPTVHNAAFRNLKLNKVYVPFRVPPEQLRSFFTTCEALDVKGISVTIPHKEDIARFLTKIDLVAKEIGAVNTVVFEDGEAVGYNTDYRAAMRCLKSVLPPGDEEKPFRGLGVLLLGAGGVAKTVAYGLHRGGAEVTIASRTFERADSLAHGLECRAVPWDARHTVKAEILVNATPVGMHPNVDETPFDKDYLHRGMVVFDTVYNPEQTLLIKSARAKECRAVTGVEMFVRQAALQFKLFTNRDAPVDVMHQELKRFTGAARY